MLELNNYEVTAINRAYEALKHIGYNQWNLVVADIMTHEMSDYMLVVKLYKFTYLY